MAQPAVRLRVLSSLTVALKTRGYRDAYAAGLLFSLKVGHFRPDDSSDDSSIALMVLFIMLV